MRIQGDKTGFYADAHVTQAAQVGGAWQYTLDAPLDLQPGYRVANPARCGHGYKIVGNIIRRNRARGMLLKADDGLVEHNLVEDSTIAGIVISPESDGNEAGYAHNVIVRAIQCGTRATPKTGLTAARQAASPFRATAAWQPEHRY